MTLDFRSTAFRTCVGASVLVLVVAALFLNWFRQPSGYDSLMSLIMGSDAPPFKRLRIEGQFRAITIEKPEYLEQIHASLKGSINNTAYCIPLIGPAYEIDVYFVNGASVTCHLEPCTDGSGFEIGMMRWYESDLHTFAVRRGDWLPGLTQIWAVLAVPQ
jgi:hypothetical protein